VPLACVVISAGCSTIYHSTTGRTYPGTQPIDATVEARDEAVRVSAAQDLACDVGSIHIGPSHEGAQYAYADGCGKRAVYMLECQVKIGHLDCPLLLASAFVMRGK
jgi:hypothetical protein